MVMFELKALRLSVGATQKQMADQMGLSLRDYRELERSTRLDADQFRSGTFAALRIAIDVDGCADRPDTELFQAFDEMLHLLERATPRSRTVH